MMFKSSIVHREDKLSQDFERIYERHFVMVYRVCFTYMKNASDTEDVVAEVFTKLLKNGVTFQSIEYEKAWLLRTAINKCKDYLKHWWHSRVNIDDYENLETINPLQENEILKIVLKLPKVYKDVVYLYYYEGFSTKEISQILKKPPSTIRNQMREARKILKGVLENEE